MLFYLTYNEPNVTCPTSFENVSVVFLVEVIPETDEEKIARLEAILLQDLRVFKHSQVIHPVLQEGEFIQTHINIPVVE